MIEYKKDPAALLDYGLDLNGFKHGVPGVKENWLAAGETVTSFTVSGDSGITITNPTQSDGLITFWVANGTEGQQYDVNVRWTTSAGRTDRRAIRLFVEER